MNPITSLKLQVFTGTRPQLAAAPPMPSLDGLAPGREPLPTTPSWFPQWPPEPAPGVSPRQSSFSHWPMALTNTGMAGVALLQENPAPVSRPLPGLEQFPDHQDVSARLADGHRRLQGEFPDCRQQIVRHEGVSFVVYRLDGGEGPPPPETEPALESVGKLGASGRTAQCLQASNELVLDQQADHLMSVFASNRDNIRGVNGVHFLAGIHLRGGAYAMLDATWPPSTDQERDLGWPQGVLIVAASRDAANRASEILYGSPPEEDRPEEWMRRKR